MSNPDLPSADSQAPAVSGIESPENLPPVEPPSAGFIIQLFVVPALIVGAVIGVWFLFGRLATSDQDWERQVNELRVENENRRWRAAYSLTQMMQADVQAGEQSAHLKTNEQLAMQLVDVLNDQMLITSPSEQDQKLRAYLILALGWLDVDRVTFPVLIEALKPENDFETRLNAITAISFIAGRDFEAGQPVANDEMKEAVVACSFDEDASFRQRAAFALGLLEGEEVDQRLRVLLEDKDEYVRVNAALALARQKSTAGIGVLVQILERVATTESPLENLKPGDQEAAQKAKAQEIEQILMATNALKAVTELAPQLSVSEKENLKPMIQKLADDFREAGIKLAAQNVLKLL